MRFARAILLVVLALGGLAALVFLLPWLKEGFGIEELPLFAGIAVGLLAALALWVRLHRAHRGPTFWAGAVLAAVPLVAYGALAVGVSVDEWRGRRLARTVRVVSLTESEILWPGLMEPIGVRLEIEIEHAIGLQGNLFAPRIVMGADPRPAYRDYFAGALNPGVDPMLWSPVFELGGPPRDVVARPGRVRLGYDMFASALAQRAGDALCLLGRASGPTGGRTAVPDGGNLGAAWFFAAEGGVIVDMSGPLTEALRRGSRLQGRADAWRALLERLEPAGLEATGFTRCAPPGVASGEPCYCPPATPAGSSTRSP